MHLTTNSQCNYNNGDDDDDDYCYQMDMDIYNSVSVNGWKNDYNLMNSKNGCDWDVVIWNNRNMSIVCSNIGDIRNMLKDF